MKPFYKFKSSNVNSGLLFVSGTLIKAIGAGKDNAVPYYKTSYEIAFENPERQWLPQDVFSLNALISYARIGLAMFIFCDERGEKMVSLVSNEEEKNEMLDLFQNEFVKLTERLTECIENGDPVDVGYGSDAKGYINLLLRAENEFRKIKV